MMMKVYIAGHNGMVGSSVFRKLALDNTIQLITKSKDELDLRNQADVNAFFKEYQPDVVIDAAARVGGILANATNPYPFLMDNLCIQNNLIEASLNSKVSKFIFLGSSCIYPKHAPQPLREEYILTGPLEPTNQWYAIAKIAGVKAVEAIRLQYGLDYISLMPTNLYGPRDNFDLTTSHVVPALLRKFHEAKKSGLPEVTVWGSGSPLREFMYVDDLAEAIVFVLHHQLPYALYNVGTGSDISIHDLAILIQSVVGYKGKITWDTTKPEGTPRKLLDTSRLADAGWRYRISLEDGLKQTYAWYLANEQSARHTTFQ